MRKFFIVLNPVSGRRDSEKKLLLVIRRFNQSGIEFNIFRTQPDLLADQILRQFFKPAEYSDILIIGGDGTISQSLNGVPDANIPVSFISSGTGNDCVRSLLGTLNLNRQIDMAIHGHCDKVDIGNCNGKLFLNGLGIGFDGKVVEEMNANGTRKKGPFSYYKTVIELIGKYKESMLNVSIDNADFNSEIFLLTVAKGKTFGGGFKLNPFAQSSDGLLDICLIKKVSILKRIIILPTMSFGGHKYLKEVQFLKCKECNIALNVNLVAHLDGEFLGHPPFKIFILPKALTLRRL